ncbi:hypothetical protein [Synechococcus sp. UW140]|uniref:hypothetical protein n=1 Tax=Synechococcus sp. UW140 TaxID=368503 RepID=UPI0031381C06
MLILFDQGTPVPLRRSLSNHLVATAYELLITTDTNLRYQQNLTGRKIAILVLTTTSWPRIRQVTAEIQSAVAVIKGGDYQELIVP